jgi:hypothetical protein
VKSPASGIPATLVYAFYVTPGGDSVRIIAGANHQYSITRDSLSPGVNVIRVCGSLGEAFDGFRAMLLRDYPAGARG